MCVNKTGVTDDVITRENTGYSSDAFYEFVDRKTEISESSLQDLGLVSN